ncbi:hypothetical protein [Rhodopirellula halodulae]|uniref:hypothetical protein n=1 Tax=Rhodopirellula halodulae TaxID=2894198 RepID=UPI001E61E4FF|nr:hypothetical protein [Rhodopirellula sp. JC737]MCC9658808.1 hypothetical protein [Rhodopirellula sp. JC737]
MLSSFNRTRKVVLVAAAILVAVTLSFSFYLMQQETARMWHHPNPHKTSIDDWAARWYSKNANYRVVAGCDCCAGVYQVRASRLSIFMFPRVVADGIDWQADGWTLPGRE